MAKKFRGEHEVTLGTEKFTLRLGLGDIEELEGRLNIGIMELGMRFARDPDNHDPRDPGKARLSDARAIIRQGFIGAGLSITKEKLDELTRAAGFGIINEASVLLLRVITDEEGNASAADGAAAEKS